MFDLPREVKFTIKAVFIAVLVILVMWRVMIATSKKSNRQKGVTCQVTVEQPERETASLDGQVVKKANITTYTVEQSYCLYLDRNGNVSEKEQSGSVELLWIVQINDTGVSIENDHTIRHLDYGERFKIEMNGSYGYFGTYYVTIHRS